MMNKFPLWKNIALIIIVLFGFVYAAPVLYGEDPSLQITGNTSTATIDDALVNKVKQTLDADKLKYKSIHKNSDNLLIRFYDTDTQFKASTVLKQAIGGNYTQALNMAAATPEWLKVLGANPMKLGLDLSGGIHMLLDVDINSVIARRVDGMVKTIADTLRKANIRYSGIQRDSKNVINISFRTEKAQDDARSILARDMRNLNFARKDANGQYQLRAQITPAFIQTMRQNLMDQTRTTLDNRVNELGIAEAHVQQQGASRISIDLPGIQDSARAKQIIGGTATLEFHMVADVDPNTVRMSGVSPPGTKLYYMQDKSPIVLKNQVVLSGNSITSATSSFGEDGRPTVNISLGGGGEAYFTRTTRENIGKRMGIVYIETKTKTETIKGKEVKIPYKVERVISAPVIQSALPSTFQITGITDVKEARDLSLLLRAGAMPANVNIVEERVVGPSLGKENIRMGVLSIEVAFILIILAMALYYNMFGIIANLALGLNVLLIIAIMSLMGFTLTLPGIAGIVLTIGMAIDANVLIFERIREELRNGMTIQAGIHAGFARALNTIVDANVTTLIVAVVLFTIGTGPIKGFAITLIIGLLTSMFTAITFTRALVNWFYGGRTLKNLPIGIRVEPSSVQLKGIA